MAGTVIYTGKGDAEGTAYWTLDNGEIKGRPYCRRRAADQLRRVWRSITSDEERERVLAATVDNDEWMRRCAGQTVGSVVRDVEEYLVSEIIGRRPIPA